MTADELRLRATEIVRGHKSKHTQTSYQRHFDRFCEWYESSGNTEVTELVMGEYVKLLLGSSGEPTAINTPILLLDKITSQLALDGLVDARVPLFVRTVGRQPKRQIDNFIDDATARKMIDAPDTSTVKGVRDKAIIALLFGCGLETNQLVNLRYDQIRDGTLCNVVGRSDLVKDYIVPLWALDAVNAWLNLSEIDSGCLFRSLWLNGVMRDRPMTTYAVYYLIRGYAKAIGASIRPRDLRRTRLHLSAADEAAVREEIAKINREIASLRRALKLKADLTPSRLSSAVAEHWERRDT